MYYTLNKSRDIAETNIKIAFPEYSLSEVKQLLKNTSKHYGMVLVDFLRMPILDANNIHNFVRARANTYLC